MIIIMFWVFFCFVPGLLLLLLVVQVVVGVVEGEVGVAEEEVVRDNRYQLLKNLTRNWMLTNKYGFLFLVGTKLVYLSFFCLSSQLMQIWSLEVAYIFTFLFFFPFFVSWLTITFFSLYLFHE